LMMYRRGQKKLGTMTKARPKLPEQDYHYFFDNASDAIWIHDLEGDILYANEAAERLTGYVDEGLVGVNVGKLMPTTQAQEINRGVRRQLLKGEEIEQPYEQRIVRKDGSIAIIKMAASVFISNGKVKGFQHIARDVTEESRSQENMRYYVQEVIKAQEDERKRIARELHDDVSPSLLLLIQQIDAITSKSHSKQPNWLKAKMETLRRQTVEGLESLRRIAQDLRPRILDDLGLTAALEWMTDNLVISHGIEAQVEVKGKEYELPSEVQLLLFRIAQEALNNIRRHAQATYALVTVEFALNKTTLTTRDNGKGFILKEKIGHMPAVGKLGLAGMQERTQLLGGNLTIKSQPGRGTVITVVVPNQCPIIPLVQSLESIKKR